MVAVIAVSLFSGASNSFAAPVWGNSTSTFIAVWSDAGTITGFSDFTYNNSTALFAVNVKSSLQGLTFTNATGTSLSVTSLAFTNASGTNFSASGYITAGTPIGVNSGGTGASTYTNGVVVASSTNSFTTIAPGANGNVLTSNGSVWQSSAPASLNPSSLTAPFTFGEDVNAGRAVYVSDGSSLSFQVDTNHTLTTGLISYWKMDGDSTDFFDSNNGTDAGSLTYDFANGKVNKGANFAGSQDIDIGSGSNLNITGNLSIAFWIKTSSAALQFVFSHESGGAPGYGIGTFLGPGTAPGQIAFMSGGVWTQQTGTINDGNWHHIVVTLSGTTVSYYKDGSLTNTATGSVPTSNAVPGVIGAQQGTSLYKLTASLDEFGIWSKALSAQEVTYLYNSGVGQTMISGGNRVAGQVYMASAANNGYSDGFIGFAATTTSANSVGDVIIGGLAQNISTNLITGKQYYLGNSSGIISTTPGTVIRKVGIAITTTTLDITNNW